MANRAHNSNIRNHIRQRMYANVGIVMLPKLSDERKSKLSVYKAAIKKIEELKELKAKTVKGEVVV